ncbi:MAG: heparinase II/III family protein [Bacteroidales bacterium]|nr:heparinase II/III family protein [Bacteroidales bacterium]
MRFKSLFAALCLAAAAVISVSCGSPEPKTGYESLTADNHPRIFFTAKDFKDIKKAVARNENPILTSLHEQLMKTADELGLSETELKYGRDASGRRLTTDGTGRLVSAAYAYKMTGDKKYLDHVEWDLKCICNYPDWVPDHFLGAATMSIGVGLAYDWLYDDLSQETKDLVVKTLRSHSIDPSMAPDPSTQKEWWWHSTSNNWNQVCECGLATAAFAIYETCPEIAKAVIEKAGSSNVNAMIGSYSPDGVYPEGPGYWSYGTNHEVLMLSEFEQLLGHDFGLSDTPGFLNTGTYQMYSTGPTGKAFNYSDGGEGVGARIAQWYFAAKNNDPSLLWLEKPYVEEHKLVGNTHIFYLIAMVLKSGIKDIPEPPAGCYTGQGHNPLMMTRTGWGKEDLYLGIKGGSASNNHAHMDAGEFVFDAYGYRWAKDYGNPGYAILEAFLKDNRDGLWDMSQDSPRWRFFTYHNLRHNTLTVNDKSHLVKATAPLKVSGEGAGAEAETDLTEIFGGDVKSAKRTASIVDGKYLSVTDCITAPDRKGAKVRWTMVTPATVKEVADGFELTQGDVVMKLHTDGAAVSYKNWPVGREARDLCPEAFDRLCDGTALIGYEITVPAGKTVELTTTLKRVK